MSEQVYSKFHGVNRDVAEISIAAPKSLSLDQVPPKWREALERAERYMAKIFPSGKIPIPIEFRFPELMEADEVAHFSFYRDGVRAPLPQNWERYGRTFTQWQLRGYDVHQLRPGISPEFLRRQGVVHVGKEHASELLGFPVSSDGLWIPYPGLNSTEMVVNGRKFGRLRLDRQTDSTRYLSAKNSGAHVYIPQGPPFGPTLILAEGEFKAISLCESGLRAISIGGISSAMSQGVLIRDLEKVLTKWPATLIFFLGDTDTVFNFEFSREAVKLAKALPAECALKLPRVPITRPKGIDDLREEELVRGDFLDFWKEITETAVDVDRRSTADALAVKLIALELPAIAASENKEALIQELVEVCSFFDPLHLGLIAKAVGKALGLPAADFRKTAQQKAATRKAEAGASAARSDRARSDDVARAINDPRPKIEIPASRDRLTSEFAAELGRVMARYSFFVKDGIVVYPDTEKTSLAVVTGRAFRTAIEDYVIPFKVATRQSGNLISLRRTISREEAESVLESSQFIKCLPKIRAVNNARFPVLRAAGHVELLPEGYDQESMIYTNPGGPRIEDLGLEKGNEFLLSKFEEFCFRDDDRERATAVAIAAMLTLFVFNIIPRGTLRPGFLYTANAEGGGKTLLARLAIVPRVGFTPIGSLPEQEEEIEKRIAAAAIAGAPTLFFDNGKRHISSGSLERAITATNLEGRILGKSQSYQIENMMTVFLTGNGATISGDLRRRVLHVDLFLREAMAENRQIQNPLDEAEICAQRAEILSALWSITTAWDHAGRPLPKLRLLDFKGWSEVVCGILEHAGFASPCTRAPSGVSGDRDTEDMFKLVAAMPRRKELRFRDLVELCREHGLFTRILGTNNDEAVEDEEFDRGQKNKLSRILTKFDNRIFPEGLTFHVDRSSKNPAFYVAPEKPKGGH